MRSDARKALAEAAAYESRFRRYAEASGQAVCPEGGQHWTLGADPCPGCRAQV